MTPAKALELLNTDAAEYSLTLLEADDATEQIFGSDIGLSADDENFLSDIVANQNFLAWAFQSFGEKAFPLEMSYDTEKLSAVIDGLSCMDKKTWRAPEDAYITYEKGTGYQIVPDAAGTVILPDKFLAAVEAAAEFVKELSKKYNAAYSSKTLDTSYGKTITIKGGFYGWQIDRKTEVENLLQVIRDGKSVTREPAYLLQAASHDGNDYGDTYVEINLTAQHLFFYKDGELVIETDFVSGDLSKGKETPDGARLSAG